MPPVVIIFHPKPHRKDLLKRIADAAGVSMSEVIRRMVDQASQQQTLDTMFPHVSGTPWFGK